MGAQNRLAVGALIVKLACIGGHGFHRTHSALRTSDDGFQDQSHLLHPLRAARTKVRERLILPPVVKALLSPRPVAS